MIRYIMQFDNARDMFLAAVATIAAIMLAIIIHEYAHGYVAKLNGDPTAQLSGRLTFNPAKHFDVIGILMFLFIGFGWARPVPVDSRNFKNYRKGMFTVAIAGVSANLILVIIAGAVLSIFYLIFSSFAVVEGSIIFLLTTLILHFLVMSISINLMLIVFNLIPIFPLDGFRVFESFAKYDNKYLIFMRRNGLYVLLGLLLIGNLFQNISPWLNPLGLYLNFVMSKLLYIITLIFPALGL